MKQKARISIIVPVYNAVAYLSRCVDALLNQTLQNIEIVLVDDGSSDGSGDVCASYQLKDERVQFVSQANSGPATARNKGLSLAQGEYVMFCDSDDWYEPTMCEEMLYALESKNVDCAMCGIKVEDELVDLNRGEEELSYYQVPCLGRFDLDDVLRMRINVCSVNKIFRKNLIDQYGIDFPEGLYNHEDDAFMFQYLGVAENIFFFGKALYHYFRRQESLQGRQMTGWNQGSRVRIDIVRFCYAWLLEQGLWSRLKGYFLVMYRLEFSQCYKNLYDEQLSLLIEAELLFCQSLRIDLRTIKHRQTQLFFQCLLSQEKGLLEDIIYGVREKKIRKYKLLSLFTLGAMRMKYQSKYLLEVGKRRKSMSPPINRD